MSAFNRALYLKLADVVADTATVSAAYAAAMGEPASVLDALLAQVVAVDPAEIPRLNLDPHRLYALRQAVLLELKALEGHIDVPVLELRGLIRVLQEYGVSTLFDFAKTSEQPTPEALRDATLWDGLPTQGVTLAGRKVENGSTMLSKIAGRRIRGLFTAEMAARAPLALPLAPAAPAEAPAVSPPFDLAAMLAAHGYAEYPLARRPTYQQVDTIRKRIKSTGFPVPWVGSRQLAFVKADWDPASAPVDNQFLEEYGDIAAQLGVVDPAACFNHIIMAKSSAMAKSTPRAAVWVASTAALVHAMVVAGCFGSQGCQWVAVCYLSVLADVAAEFDYGWAAAYDMVVRRKGEQDPTFGSAQALPFYTDINQDILLNLKMRLSVPAHRTAGAGGASSQPRQPASASQAQGADAQEDKAHKRRRRGGQAESLKPFPKPPAGGYPAIMPPPPPTGTGGKGVGKAAGKGKGKGKGSTWP